MRILAFVTEHAVVSRILVLVDAGNRWFYKRLVGA